MRVVPFILAVVALFQMLNYAKAQEDTGLKNGIETWKKHGECDKDFFDKTNANFASSKYIDFYNHWLDGVKANKTRKAQFEKFGGVSLFAREMYNGFDQDCRVDFSEGCSKTRSCGEILQHTASYNPTLPLGEILVKGRQIYFVQETMLSINQILASKHDTLVYIQENVNGHVDRIVGEFSQQVDKNADAICQLVKTSVDLAVSTLLSMASPLPGCSVCTPGLAMSIGKMLKDYGVAVRENGLPNGEGQEGKTAHLTPQWVKDECAAIGAGRSNMNSAHAASIRVIISRAFSGYRNITEETFNQINGATNLTLVLAKGDWTMDFKRKKDRSASESAMIEQFKQWLISILMQGSQCFIKCQRNLPMNQTYQQEGQQTTINTEYRYWPSNSEVCQAECWTTIGERNHEVPLIGQENLGNHNITVEELLESSYSNFVNRNHSYTVQPELTLNTTNGVEFNKGESLLSLPICISQNVEVSNISNWRKDDPTGILHKHIKFPCTCGDWRSNESSSFMQQLGLDFEAGNPRTEYSKELFQDYCPSLLSDLPPLNRFFAFCELGVKWPHMTATSRDRNGLLLGTFDEGTSIVMNKTDPHCGELLGLASSMTEREGNDFFCNRYEKREEIFMKEKSWLDNAIGGPQKSSYRKCKDWR